MPSADVKTLGESAPAAGTTDEPQTQTVAEASEPQSADPRGSATARMPDVESQSTDPNEASASEADAQATDSDAAPEHSAGSFFEKLSGKLSQVTDRLRGMQQKTDQLKQQTAYYKRIWDQPQTRQAGWILRAGRNYQTCTAAKAGGFWNRRDRRSGFYRTDHGDTGNAVSLA